MKRLNWVLLIVLLLSVGMVRQVAADDRTCTSDSKDGSNLPLCNTPADNECYPGGMMADKCQTLQDWRAGWYLARLNRGVITTDELPADFKYLAPAAGGGQSANGGCSATYNQTTGEIKGSGNWNAAITGQTNANMQFVFKTISYGLIISVFPTQTTAGFSGKVIAGLSFDSASLNVISPGVSTTIAFCSVSTVS